MVISVLVLSVPCVFASNFEAPILLKANNSPIMVEEPGWASPSLADLDGDGKKELLVGQFNQGKIHVFKKGEQDSYKKGPFLKADNEIAKIPGIW